MTAVIQCTVSYRSVNKRTQRRMITFLITRQLPLVWICSSANYYGLRISYFTLIVRPFLDLWAPLVIDRMVKHNGVAESLLEGGHGHAGHGFMMMKSSKSKRHFALLGLYNEQQELRTVTVLCNSRPQ